MKMIVDVGFGRKILRITNAQLEELAAAFNAAFDPLPYPWGAYEPAPVRSRWTFARFARVS